MLDSGLGTPIRQPQITNQYRGDITRVASNHILKFGFDIRYERVHFEQTDRAHGNYQFTGTYTGNGYADFLLGLPYEALRGFEIDDYGDVWKSYHFYVQDDWKVRPDLTLNLGLRYEYSPQAVSNTGAATTFDTDIDPSAGRFILTSDHGQINFNAQRSFRSIYDTYSAGGYKFVTNDQAGLPPSLATNRYKNFGPRFGLAWRPWGDPKTVVRAGAGIFYEVENSNWKTFNLDFPVWLREVRLTPLQLLHAPLKIISLAWHSHPCRQSRDSVL